MPTIKPKDSDVERETAALTPFQRGRRGSDSSISSYQKDEQQEQQQQQQVKQRGGGYDRHISMEMPEDTSISGYNNYGGAVISRKSRSLLVLTVSSLLIFGVGIWIVSHWEGKGVLIVTKDETNDKRGGDCGISDAESLNSLKGKSSLTNLSNGAVATDVPLCSKLGLETLKNGGNAIDAAVTSTLCLGIANPASSGIGGGAFILLHVSGSNTTEVIDARESAPSAASRDMFETSSSTEGGGSVGIMGELRGLELAHRRHGVLSWGEVVDPVLGLAEEGVVVSPYLAHEIDESREEILRNEDLARLLSRGNDGVTLLRAGDVLRNVKLGETMRAVREGGADAVYTGRRARELVKEVNEAGGVWTVGDLEGYEPVIREPLIAEDVFGFTMVGVPPPSSGGAAVIGAARFLQGYKEAYASFRDTLSVHRLVEGMKHVFAMRMSLSDTDYGNGTEAEEAVRDLMDPVYMESLRNMTMDDGVLPLWKYGGEKWAQIKEGGEGIEGEGDGKKRRRRMTGFHYLEDHGTSHVSVVDKDRNAVALTSTVNLIFGSKLVSKSTGIILNDEMDDFSSPGSPNAFGIIPSPENYIVPHKKPLSSMSPTLTFLPSPGNPLARLHMCLGASGGPKIITATLQTFLNYAVLGMPLYDAVVRSRVHDQLLQQGVSKTLVDHDNLVTGQLIQIKETTRGALLRRGHSLEDRDYMGIVQAIAVDLDFDGGNLTVVSDIRKDGEPAGY